jgi:hypothetical protein
MNVGQFEDFLVCHAEEMSATTALVVEVETADGAMVIVATTDVVIRGDQVVIHSARLPY